MIQINEIKNELSKQIFDMKECVKDLISDKVILQQLDTNMSKIKSELTRNIWVNPELKNETVRKAELERQISTSEDYKTNLNKYVDYKNKIEETEFKFDILKREQRLNMKIADLMICESTVINKSEAVLKCLKEL